MRLGSKAKLTIGVGLVAACSFAVMGLRELGRSSQTVPDLAAHAAAQNVAPARPLLVATTRTIRTGETIRADMIRNATADLAKFPTAASSVEVLGKVATHDIPANSLIPRSVIDQETKLAIRVPMGMRAISIDTTAEIAVAGLVRPGDRVDVQVVYPGEDAISGARGSGRSEARTLLQMVPVLAVGDVVVGTPPRGGIASDVNAPPPPARTVTLALSPEQVSRLSLAKNTGALYLSLRNPSDQAQVELAAEETPRSLAPSAPRSIAPVRTAPKMVQRTAVRPAPRPASKPHAIELVVGGNSQTIYSGSAPH
ncbi:pilus assembly protein CpaB [Novosphingobium sp. PhB165]|uniref:Flp pilus assembly protein CpaB n=1 Tax=Novosphingobium sp. PhB165 TaxID=2485105 RepID=UPI001043F165|nr:Flp pilus assembly protein CpaB [Novosphingobium sp. PhB165]TCM15375.1 pilus assembly protein CpaB [Novosphingobium sp. PhB165]